MDDDLMAIWQATQGSTVCTCRLCRNLGVEELEIEYNWAWAERSMSSEWMLDDDGLAPLYMERQRVYRERAARSKRRKSWFRRLVSWVRHG